MNSLTSGIEAAIKLAIEEYVECITSKYKDIKSEDLEKMWNSVSKSMKITVSSKKTEITSPPPKKPSDADSVSENGDGCTYKFIKGTRKGEDCGGKTKDDNTYCSRHKKFEGTTQTEKKAMAVFFVMKKDLLLGQTKKLYP